MLFVDGRTSRTAQKLARCDVAPPRLARSVKRSLSEEGLIRLLQEPLPVSLASRVACLRCSGSLLKLTLLGYSQRSHALLRLRLEKETLRAENEVAYAAEASNTSSLTLMHV